MTLIPVGSELALFRLSSVHLGYISPFSVKVERGNSKGTEVNQLVPDIFLPVPLV